MHGFYYRYPTKLQALVYDILPSTTAIFSYAIGPRKLSANEQFFVGCSDSSKFVTNNSDYMRRLCCHVAYASSNKTKSFESKWNFFCLPGVDASHVYVRAWALWGCFHSLISTQTFRRALTASVDSCAEIECLFSGITKSGRVWRKVPENDARSVIMQYPNLSDGADRVGGQLRGDKECPFSGV